MSLEIFSFQLDERVLMDRGGGLGGDGGGGGVGGRERRRVSSAGVRDSLSRADSVSSLVDGKNPKSSKKGFSTRGLDGIGSSSSEDGSESGRRMFVAKSTSYGRGEGGPGWDGLVAPEVMSSGESARSPVSYG
jgi:hypothetical protein